jgi:hypothetical protein
MSARPGTGRPLTAVPRRASIGRSVAVAAGGLLGGLLFALLASAPAGADVFESISLRSASPFQQVEYAHDPAISGNGRYVVFDGSIGGVTGVWRRENIPGGELVQVAGGDAELPSISENGQYVSFTTNEGSELAADTDGLPDVNTTHEAPNVYVRDMSKSPSEADAFALASDLSYEYPSEDREFDETHFGSEAAGRTAISADGQKVVFVTTAISDLDGPGTPPLQVAVHDFRTGKTELVSVAYDPASGRPTVNQQSGQPEPVQLQNEGTSIYGAVYAYGRPPTFIPPTQQIYSLPSEIGASISADGSTVAWMGQNIGGQARMLSEESVLPQYGEPLWRRIVGAGGEPSEESATRRVTGGSDPADPQCAADPERVLPTPASAQDPCQGPFVVEPDSGVWGGGVGESIPRLSADGYEVAFLASAPLIASGTFGGAVSGRHDDAYVADMHEGLSRTQALTPLTELASGEESRVATNAPILNLGISPDGTQVAFTTKRTVFPLGSPTYVSAPASVPGLNELFEVDLTDDTLTRVTHGYEGGASEHPHQAVIAGEEDEYKKADDGALAPSFSNNGGILAFSSTASNLVYGDGNTPPLGSETDDGSDVFVVNRVLPEALPATQYVSSGPGVSITPAWSLGVTAVSLRDGELLLYVEVPGPGTLSAGVSSSVPVRSSVRSSRSVKGGRRAARQRAASVRTHTVASATRHIADGGGGEPTTLLLKLAPSYSALAAQKGGLSGLAELTFTAPGHQTLHQSLAVSFIRVAPKKAAARRPRITRKSRSRVRGRHTAR